MFGIFSSSRSLVSLCSSSVRHTKFIPRLVPNPLLPVTTTTNSLGMWKRYYAKVSAIDLSIGDCILYKGKIVEIISAHHVRHAQSKGLVQAEMRDLLDGRKREERFRSAEQVEVVDIESQKVSFVKKHGGKLEFEKDNTSIRVDESFFGNKVLYLTKGTTIVLKMYEGKPLSFQFLKPLVPIRVKETEFHSKNDQENPRPKPATLQNGCIIKVAPYVNTGDVILVDVEIENFHSRPLDELFPETPLTQKGEEEVEEEEEEEEEEVEEEEKLKKKK